MKTILFILMLTTLMLVLYWGFVVSTSTSYLREANETGLQECVYILDGNKRGEDSCRYRRAFLEQQRENTLLLIPKFLRP